MSSPTVGRSLELFFVDGKPDGMLTAEMFNWTGHILKVPRTRLPAALARKEAQYTGVYLLLGEVDEEPLAYIGEGENISARIKNHDAQKDWWSTAVFITAAANNLNKAHVKYLEARLVEIANRTKRIRLENGNVPPRPGLTEASEANMAGFLDHLLMILPALQVDIFSESTKELSQTGDEATRRPKFELYNKQDDIRADATLIDGDFIVEQGSQARATWVSQAKKHHSYRKLRVELELSEVLLTDETRCEFAKSYAFKSPSAAAAVVLGRPSNGRLEWKVRGSSLTYKDWEAEQLEQAAVVDR